MTAHPPHRRTGLPDVDALLDRANADQAKLNDLMAVSSAERTVMDARADGIAAAQKAARRKASAAENRVTRAREDGGALEIAAAQAEYEAVCRETREIQAAGELGRPGCQHGNRAEPVVDFSRQRRTRRVW